MPRKTNPKLRLHKATQTAYVGLNRHRIYLCKWDHPDRQQKYFSILAEWERAGHTQAKEPEPIRPALDEHVDAIKPFVSRHVHGFPSG